MTTLKQDVKNCLQNIENFKTSSEDWVEFMKNLFEFVVSKGLYAEFLNYSAKKAEEKL